ncbi:enoyl-CoA hydratase [Novosphingobium sp. KCTC 2891]|uniref:enoyl-CoA hydratase n=1 Tax=Novosphingobium sp. KCTC 2891 TaxID=2989730 RepID=UPI002223B949|nr:enoyl-CoA hydratase [Novosphingobium sp. KCTC 2891]MCW1383861.1 enoyl-CoA hydratase [Novosphingobium sp. KCTC 2891]
MSELVLIEKRDNVAVVTLNRPEAMNALSRGLRDALAQAMQQVAADPDVSVVVLTGAGERAFCAGLDLKELGTEGGLGAVAPQAGEPADPVHAIEHCPKPVIGAINGVAITGGFEVAIACDVLIASDKARFADTHARVGILPGWGLSQKLPRLIGIGRYKEMAFTGNFIDAAKALEWGLVNRVVPAGELLDTALALAAEMATIPAATLSAYKAQIDGGNALAYGEGRTHEKAQSRAFSAAVTPEQIASRVAGVQARGRTQAN